MTHLLRSVHLAGRDLTLNKAGLFEFFSFPGLDVLAASGVGGGSIGLGRPAGSHRTIRRYWHGRHPALDPAGVEAYYDKVIADWARTAFIAELSLPHSIWTHLPQTPRTAARPRTQQPAWRMLLPRALAEAGRASTIAAGLERGSAPLTATASWVPAAAPRHRRISFTSPPGLDRGATVRDLCEVSGSSAAIAVARATSAVHDLAAENRQEQCARPAVVLAAGTMNTLRLLFASASRPGRAGADAIAGRRSAPIAT